jgi:hypothetical protein
MPKRSTPFQKIVTYIATKLAPEGATVRESVELTETGTGTPREIDTLVESSVGITTVNVAIESRERSRRESVQWIGELIGTYADLPVDRVLAVSRSGFSEGARKKAKLHNIEPISPEDLPNGEWPAAFTRIGAAAVKGRLKLQRVNFQTTPPLTKRVSAADQTRHNDKNGAAVEGSAEEFVKELTPVVGAKVKEFVSKKFLSIYKTRGDLKKTAVLEFPFPLTHHLSLIQDGSSHKVDKVDFVFHFALDETPVPVEHRMLTDKGLLSSGRVGEVEFLFGQAAGVPEGKVVFEKKQSKSPSRPTKHPRRSPKASER